MQNAHPNTRALTQHGHIYTGAREGEGVSSHLHDLLHAGEVVYGALVAAEDLAARVELVGLRRAVLLLVVREAADLPDVLKVRLLRGRK